MNKLEIVTYTNYKVSIKDSLQEVNLSEAKWNFLINGLNEKVEGAYFYGLRISFKDRELYETIDYLSEKMLFNKDDNYNRILFRIKPFSLMYGRKLIHYLSEYYVDSFLIFLKNKKSEDKLLDEFTNNLNMASYFVSINGYYVVYVGVEKNVLWINSDQDLTWIDPTDNRRTN